MLTQEAKAKIVLDVIREDRAEIRFQEDKIYNMISAMTIASFAITAFVMGNKSLLTSSFGLILLPIADLALIAVLCTTFITLRRNLDFAQLFLEGRERLLRRITTAASDAATEPFIVYENFDLTIGPQIKHAGPRWIFRVSIVVLALKAIVSFVLIVGRVGIAGC
jgi:hypothetical protein